METQHNDDRNRDERGAQNSGNAWQGDESQRLSNYDEGNESDNFTNAQDRNSSGSANRDESEFENNDGFNSDSSSTMDARDTDDIENDPLGQRLDDMDDDIDDDFDASVAGDLYEDEDDENLDSRDENTQRDQGL